MDRHDDLALPPEFKFSPDQKDAVERAVSIAVKLWSDVPEVDAPATFNPLILILEWWSMNVPEAEQATGAPEVVLTDACRRFAKAHGMKG